MEQVLLPGAGTSAYLLLGVRPCEILEVVPLFENFKADLPFRMAINMKVIGVLLFHASEETAVLAEAICKWAQANQLGVLSGFLEVKASGVGGSLQFFSDKVQCAA